jgi:hypothetical protein
VMDFDLPKINHDALVQQLTAQARAYGKPIRLVRFEAVHELVVIDPRN